MPAAHSIERRRTRFKGDNHVPAAVTLLPLLAPLKRTL
jgi:hypothetical protein